MKLSLDLEERGLLFFANQSFKKNGQTLQYQRVGLTDEGRKLLANLKVAPSVAIQKQAIERRRGSGRFSNYSKKRQMVL